MQKEGEDKTTTRSSTAASSSSRDVGQPVEQADVVAGRNPSQGDGATVSFGEFKPRPLPEDALSDNSFDAIPEELSDKDESMPELVGKTKKGPRILTGVTDRLERAKDPDEALVGDMIEALGQASLSDVSGAVRAPEGDASASDATILSTATLTVEPSTQESTSETILKNNAEWLAALMQFVDNGSTLMDNPTMKIVAKQRMNDADWAGLSSQACVTIQTLKQYFHGTHLDMLQTKLRQGYVPKRKYHQPNFPTSFHLRTPEKIERFVTIHGKEIQKEDINSG